MAKHTQNTNAPKAPTNDVEFLTVRLPHSSGLLKYKDWSVNVADLTADGIAYLLQNGFTQSLTDAAAFSKADKAGKTEAEIEEMARAARDKKFAHILAGTVGTKGPSAPRKVGLDKIMQTVAIEDLKAACAAAKITWPQKAADQAPLIEKYLAKHGEKVRAEAQRRLDAASETIDLTDILG